jgi:predicted RNA binding protein YcfA (HicA-like mRNA interferase family)
MDKQGRVIVKRLQREGWAVEITSGNHVKLTHPGNGGVVIASLTSGDRFSWRRLERNIAQVEAGLPTR